MNQSGKSQQMAGENALKDTSFLDLTPAQKCVLARLDKFLNEHESPIGKILLGAESGRWTAKDMRKLESMIVKESNDLRETRDLLRVLRKVVASWAMRHVEAVAFPRIPVIPVYPKNPFSSDLPRQLIRYEEWKKWLTQWLQEDGSKLTGKYKPISTAVPVIVSAILYGGLCSMSSILALIRTLGDLTGNAAVSETQLFVDLRISSGWTVEPEYRNWRPDGVTARLLLRTLPSSVAGLLTPPDATLPDFGPNNRILSRRIGEQFKNYLTKSRGRFEVPLGGLNALIKAAQTVAHIDLPGVVAEYASGKLVSHSLSREVIRRITKRRLIDGPKQSTSAVFQISEQPGRKKPVVDPLKDLPPDWLEPLRRVMRTKDRAAFSRGFSSLSSDFSLTPFVRRLAEFGQSILVLRSKSDERRSINALRGIILEVALGIGPFLLDGADPVTLSTEALEHLYEQAIESRGTSDSGVSRRRKVIGALREFDSYMRSCYVRKKTEDSKLLVPIEGLGSVDANIITPDEYRRTLKRIPEEWPIDQHYNRPKIARALVILGYRCGLRRLEALHLKVQDVMIDGPAEIVVRPSDSHRLKSANAKRRLPLSIFLEPDELIELKKWHSYRTGKEQNARTHDYLFGNALEELEVLPQTIFTTINGILQKVTGTTNAEKPIHFHHCRHSFCTFGFLKLMLSGMKSIPDVLPGCDDLMSWLREGSTFEPAKLSRHIYPNRQQAYLMADLMGHGSPSTSMTYIHSMNWILEASLAQSTRMHPDLKFLELAAGVSEKTIKRLSNSGDDQEAWKKLWLWRVKLCNSTAQKVTSLARISTGTLASPSLWIDQIERCLKEFDKPDQSIKDAAIISKIEVYRALEIIDRAEHLRDLTSKIGTLRHRFEEVVNDLRRPDQKTTGHCPIRPQQGVEREIVERYAPLIAKLNSESTTQPLLKAGLDGYVNAVWSTKNFAVFHHPDTEGIKANTFFDLLLALKIQFYNVGFIRFTREEQSGWVRQWRKALHRRHGLDFETQKLSNTDSESKESWLAIEPRFHFAQEQRVMSPGLSGFRFLMVMAYIAFGTLPEPENGIKDSAQGHLHPVAVGGSKSK